VIKPTLVETVVPIGKSDRPTETPAEPGMMIKAAFVEGFVDGWNSCIENRFTEGGAPDEVDRAWLRSGSRAMLGER